MMIPLLICIMRTSIGKISGRVLKPNYMKTTAGADGWHLYVIILVVT